MAFKFKKEKLTTLIELWERNEEIVDEIYRACQICKKDYVINAWDFLWHHVYLYIYESYDPGATLAIGYNDGSQILYARGIILAINKIFWDQWKDCEEARAFFLAHELMHVFMGHLNLPPYLSRTDLNIVADMTIHEILKIPECVLERARPIIAEEFFGKFGIKAEKGETFEYYLNLYMSIKKDLQEIISYIEKHAEGEISKDDLEKTIESSDFPKEIKETLKDYAEKRKEQERLKDELVDEIIKRIEKDLEKKGEKLTETAKKELRKKLKNSWEQVPPDIHERLTKTGGAGLEERLRKAGIHPGATISLIYYDWKELFRNAIGYGIGHARRTRYTWLRPWKKTGVPPGIVRTPPPKVGIVFDVSGSMTDVADDIAAALRELFRQYQNEAEFWVVECDTEVQKGPYQITAGWTNFYTPATEGGTELNPGIRELNRLGPFDVFIIATDGEVFEPLIERPLTKLLVALYPPKYTSLKKYYPDIYEITVKTEMKIKIS